MKKIADPHKISFDAVDVQVDYSGSGTRRLRLVVSADVAELRALHQILDELLLVDCLAVIHHGPGGQSIARCERTDWHGPDDEHHAPNPATPGFTWTGPEGWVD